MINALRRAFPGLLAAWLTRRGDGSWLDVILWRTRAEAESAAEHVDEVPAAAAWLRHIAESHGLQHLDFVDHQLFAATLGGVPSDALHGHATGLHPPSSSLRSEWMTTQHTALAERAIALRGLHAGPRPLVLPNAWDVASARLVVKAGFPVVATSSGAVAASLGYEDTDSMPVHEAFGVVARIARSVAVPVTADIEAGYGLSPAELVGRLLEAGAVGCNLEDTDHHGGGGLVDADAHVERLRAIRQAANDAGVDIVLNARVDVLRFDGDRRELFEEAVRRAQRYLQAGGDCVFPIRLADDELIREFVRRVEGPVNVVSAGAPPLARLAELGVRRISFAGTLMNQLYGLHQERLAQIAGELGQTGS